MAKKTKKVSKKWEAAPEYITQSGVTYEKLYDNTVNVELSLEPSLAKCIEDKARSGLYVSDKEFVRDVIRSVMGSVKSIESAKKAK